jgi:hypothetical protein
MRNPGASIEIAAVIFAIRFIAVEARFERSSRRGDAIIFRPVLGLRILFGFGIPGILYVVASQLAKTDARSDLPYALGLLFFAVFIFVMWPGTILVSETSIRETRWLGLKRTCIPWSEVNFAGGDVENAVTVRSKDDRIIQHTQYHVDRAGFIEALKKYCEKCSYNYPVPKPWVPLGSP